MYIDNKSLTDAISEWVSVLGAGFVHTLETAPAEYLSATFACENKPSALLLPGSRDDVVAVVEIARKFKLPIYPISRGRNIGLGSRLPSLGKSVVIDLRRLDTIIDYNEELAYVEVEPGVTFEQMSAFLKQAESNLYLPVIGGPAGGSLIGNLADRGDGIGPGGDRVSNCCGLEILLPTGEIVNTGFGRHQHSPVKAVHQHGSGPSLLGMFTQSNYGIILRAIFWLRTKPERFSTLLFGVRDDEQLALVSENIRDLMRQDVVKPLSVAVLSASKLAAIQDQDTSRDSSGESRDHENRVSQPGPWNRCEWVVAIGIYAASNTHGRALEKIIRKSVRKQAVRAILINPFTYRLIKFVAPLVKRILGRDLCVEMRALFEESVFLGHCTEQGLKSCYPQKRAKRPKTLNPELDDCGVLWACPTIPLEKSAISKALKITREKFIAYGFEPIFSMPFLSSRCLFLLPTIVYDRTVSGMDELAARCHQELIAAYNDAGFYSHRLGINSMDTVPASLDDTDAVLERLKEALDPYRILSPGRYERRDLQKNSSAPSEIPTLASFSRSGE